MDFEFSRNEPSHEASAPETRLQEAEIKLAFLEKELGDAREAVDALYAELSRLTRRVRALETRQASPAGEGEPDSAAAS